MVRGFAARLGKACAFLLLTSLLSLGASAATLVVFLDTDNHSGTGCTLPIPGGGTFAGAELVLTTVVDTSTNPPTVGAVTQQDCVVAPAGLSAPAPVAAGGWNVGVGLGVNGYDVIETFIPINTPPANYRVGFYYTDPISGTDSLVTVSGGGPIIFALPGQANAIPVLTDGAIFLLALLIFVVAARALRRHHVPTTLVVGLFAVLMAGATLAAIVLDGQITDWAGVHTLATDPTGDASVGSDIAAVFAKAENNRIYFRADVKTAALPTANADTYSTLAGVPLAVPASGVLANDVRGVPQADVLTFGGGNAGGTAATNAANATATFGTGSLTVNANGSLAFTPDTGFTGPFLFSYVIGNPSGNSTGQVTINVNQAPAITSANNATFVVGVANTFTVTTTGFPSSTVTLTGCALPANLTFTNNGNGTATIAGTAAPGTGGTYTCTLNASNGIGAPAAQAFTLTVNQAPAITSANAFTFIAGSFGTFTVTTTGVPTNASMAIGEAGALPGGVSFVNNNNGTATLSGTPAAGGSFPIVITANNGVAPNATQSFTITVNQAPAITSANNATFAVGAANSFGVTTTGFPTPALTFGACAPALPGTLGFVDNGNGTGTLSGNPPSGSAGTYNCTAGASNGVGAPASQPFALTIQELPIANPDSYNVTHDSTLIVPAGSGLLSNDTGSPTPTVVQANACVAFACAIGTANGNALVQADGSFTYTPNALFAGVDTFTYVAGNVQGNSAPATVTLTVNNAAPVVDLNGPAGGIGFGPVAFTEGNAPVAIVDPVQLAVSDADSPNLASATATITNLLDDPDETIGYTCPVIAPGCSGAIQAADVVYAPATGTLTITRSAPLADYEALLSTLTYHNAADDPDTTTRVITVKVNDGIVDSAPLATVSVTLTATNDAPTITAPATASTAVNTALPFPGTITVADVDAGTSAVKVTLTVTNGIATLSGTAGLTVTGNATASVVATGSLTSLNAALNGMTYTPTAAYNGPATLKIDVDDQGNTGTPATPMTATHTVNITVDTLPTVSTVVPANGSASVALNSTVAVTFSEAVTATATAFKLECPAGSPKAFTVVPALPATNTLFTLTPATPFTAGVTCTFTAVAAQVTDSSAQNMAADFVSTFTVDTLPTVTATVPTSGANGVGPVAPITITFSEPVNATAASFTLQCPVATPQAFTFAASPPQSFVLTPNPALPTSTLCTLTVLAAQVTDVDAGQNMAANFSTTFTTAVPPAFTSAASALFTLNAFGTFTVTTTGNPAAVVSETGALPAGVSFAPGAGGTATIAGTPTASGSFPLTLTATNLGGAPTQAFTLQVCPVITVNPATILQPTTGNVYAQTLTGSGGTAGYTFTSTLLPAGMTLSGAGVLGGTVTASGAYSFTVTATDSVGCTGTATYSGTINQPPVANADTFETVGNTLLEVAGASVAADPKIFVAGNVLANDSDPDGGTLAVASVGTFATVSGGSITLAADGTFTYLPPVGTIVSDSFVYTLTDGAGTAPGTINLHVLAPRIWYVKNDAPGGGDGRSTTPFNTLAPAIGASVAGDTIYVFNGDGLTTGQNAGAALKPSQRFIGQGVALTVPTTVNGVPTPTLIGASGAPHIGNTGGNAVTLSTDNTVSGMVLGNSTAFALFGNNVGALQVSTVAISTGGAGMDITGVGAPTVNMSFLSVFANGGSKGVNLVGLNGTVNLGSGALTGAAGNAFEVSGGNADVSFSGTITAANAGAPVVITGKTGGTVTLSGAITSTGVATAGIGVTSNTGATINFSGTLNISTGTNAAFTATGGGTVTSTNAASTLTTTTGTALNVANTTIGAGGLNFTSISSNGGGNGIFLLNTGPSAGLTVNGDGTNTAQGGNGSGGTIGGTSGADGSTTGSGVFLSNTGPVTLRRMVINGVHQGYGIKGTRVNGFTLEYSRLNGTYGTAAGLAAPENAGEGTIYFGNLTTNGIAGAARFVGNVIQGGRSRNLSLINTTGTTTLTVKGNLFGLNQNFTDANQSLLVETRNAGTRIDAIVGGPAVGDPNTFTGAPGDLINFTGQDATLINVNVLNNTLTNAHASNVIGGGGVTFASQGTMNLDMEQNTMSGADGSAVTLQLGATGTLLSTRLVSNTIGVTGVADSGSKSGNGIFGSFAGSGIAAVTLTGNTIQQYAGNAGMYFDNTGGDYDANFTISGNVVRQPGAGVFAGLAMSNGASGSSDAVNVCADIRANDFSASAPVAADSIFLLASGTGPGTHVFNLPTYAGGANLTNVATFVRNNNLNPGTTQVTATFDAPASAADFTGTGTTCPTP